MLALETIITFFTASMLLSLAPGPDNIFVLTQSTIHGKGAGLTVMLGLCTGLIVHTIAVSLGVAAIFKTSEIAFSILKYIGAGYLIYLAWHAFRASSEKLQGKSDKLVGYKKLYSRGVIMNITNPKVSIFFLAFLPQFIDTSKGAVTIQFLVLGSLFILATISVFGSIALLAGTLGKFLNSSDKAQLTLNKIGGIVFIGLALKLAFTER